MARFHSHSAGDVALIPFQRRDATRVAGYQRWKELGRQVKKGERGIKILVPHKRKITDKTEDQERFVVSSFGVGSVFDGLSPKPRARPFLNRRRWCSSPAPQMPACACTLISWTCSSRRE